MILYVLQNESGFLKDVKVNNATMKWIEWTNSFTLNDVKGFRNPEDAKHCLARLNISADILKCEYTNKNGLEIIEVI